jgi:hypothetical protein
MAVSSSSQLKVEDTVVCNFQLAVIKSIGKLSSWPLEVEYATGDRDYLKEDAVLLYESQKKS